MDDRTEIAARVMAGILSGMFMERPTTRPTPAKIATMALEYSDALLSAGKKDSEGDSELGKL